jgi:hypothetical protein
MKNLFVGDLDFLQVYSRTEPVLPANPTGCGTAVRPMSFSGVAVPRSR